MNYRLKEIGEFVIRVKGENKNVSNNPPVIKNFGQNGWGCFILEIVFFPISRTNNTKIDEIVILRWAQLKEDKTTEIASCEKVESILSMITAK